MENNLRFAVVFFRDRFTVMVNRCIVAFYNKSWLSGEIEKVCVFEVGSFRKQLNAH